MGKKFECPMMCGMQMMYQPESLYMKPGIMMAEEGEMDYFFEDEEDDRQFMRMYPESCKKMMSFIKTEIDRMEEKCEAMHDNRPDREMIRIMADNAYNRMIKDMPEMTEKEETRQYPAGRFSRDLLRLLLLNELFRRRRRHRRRNYYGYPFGRYGFYEDFYYYD